MDLALGIQSHDLDIVNGDLYLVSGLDATAQRLKIKLRFFYKEWFLNLDVGIPYWESIFVKSPNLAVINAIYRKVILDDPAVLGLNEFRFEFNNSARSATLTFKADTKDGPLVFDEEMIIPTADRLTLETEE
jgi:hypothetical protein